MQTILASRFAFDLDLASDENAIADCADAFVVERIPFPFPVHPAQDVEAFLGQELSGHAGI